MFGAIPKGVTESKIILDRHRIDGRVYFEAALLEHHHGRVIDAGALWKDEYGTVGLVLDVLAHAACDRATIFRLGSVEPDVIGGARERSLHHASEAAVLLANHRVAVVGRQNDDVDR